MSEFAPRYNIGNHHPRSLSTYIGFPLYAGLFSYLSKHEIGKPCIDSGGTKRQPSAYNQPLLQGIVAIFVGLSVSLYLF